MADLDAFGPLRALARELPFDLDDTDAAAAAYGRWRAGEAAQRRHAELWAYLYAWRYFAVKFLREPNRPAADQDVLVTTAFGRVVAHFDAVRDPARFAAWVSVVCKNTFRNYLRRPATTTPLTDEAAEALAADSTVEAEDEALDAPHLRRVLDAAFAALPDYLREVARRRLVEGEPYESISEALGKPVPILRSYVNKTVERFRADPALRRALGLET